MADHSTLLRDDCILNGHNEKPGCMYFSGRTPRDQLISGGMDEQFFDISGQVTASAIACRLEPSQFMAGMLAAPYHRLSMMNPRTKFAGFATFWMNHFGYESWSEF